jgi:hypothetical protein
VSEAVPERTPMPVEGHPGDWSEHRRAGIRLLRRLLVYHLVLAACLAMMTIAFPDFSRHLPVGGVRELAGSGASAVGKHDLPASPADAGAAAGAFSAASMPDRLDTGRQLVITLVAVWLLMLPVSWVHKGIHRVSVHDHSLDETVLILPGIVASIVFIVQHSLALAFSLAGIIAGVQFRRSLQDTFDALFILVAIGAGIAAGAHALEIAAVLTVFFAYSTLYVHYFGDGLESDFQARKKAEKKRRKKTAEDDDTD